MAKSHRLRITVDNAISQLRRKSWLIWCYVVHRASSDLEYELPNIDQTRYIKYIIHPVEFVHVCLFVLDIVYVQYTTQIQRFRNPGCMLNEITPYI